MIDPVCNTKVDDKSTSIIHNNKKHYFCCPTCKWAFEQNPKDFIKESPNQ